MNNFKEWMVKSILVRAIYRDEKIKEMERALDKTCKCCECGNLLDIDEVIYCDACDNLVCCECKREWGIICVVCNDFHCNLSRYNSDCGHIQSWHSCGQCEDPVCNECAISSTGGFDYVFCCEYCKDEDDKYNKID